MSAFQNIREFYTYINGSHFSDIDRQCIKCYLQYIEQRGSGNFSTGVETNARNALEYDTRLELYHLAVSGLALLRRETRSINMDESRQYGVETNAVFDESSRR